MTNLAILAHGWRLSSKTWNQ